MAGEAEFKKKNFMDILSYFVKIMYWLGMLNVWK
jgi:hypothetical protein